LPCILPKKLVPRLSLTVRVNVPTVPCLCAKKVLGVTNKPTAASSSALSGSLLLYPVREGAYEEKKCLYKNLVVISTLSVQMRRQQGAYLSSVHTNYHDGEHRNCLFGSLYPTQKRKPVSPCAVTVFFSLKSQNPLN
jgi:hypothetical protein